MGSVIIRNMAALSDPVDRYFTEQVVGPAIVVEMGPAASRRNLPSQGVLLDPISRQAELFGVGVRSLFAPEPWRAVAGTPVVLAQMQPLRMKLLLGGLAVWSLALWAAFVWIAR